MNHGLIRLIAEHSTLVLGKLGFWTARLVSLGKWDVDEESWTALILGWFVFLALIVSGACWQHV